MPGIINLCFYRIVAMHAKSYSYTYTKCNIIILMDDGIKHDVTYISISRKIHQHLFSDFSHFYLPVKEKEKQGIKG